LGKEKKYIGTPPAGGVADLLTPCEMMRFGYFIYRIVIIGRKIMSKKRGGEFVRWARREGGRD